jgi:hypothetical protein
MSDPRYTDPRYTDPNWSANPGSRRDFDIESRGRSRAMWTWAAAIIAVVVVFWLAVGYHRTDEARYRSDGPSTTGAAPTLPRPVAPAASGGTAAPPASSMPAPVPDPLQGR